MRLKYIVENLNGSKKAIWQWRYEASVNGKVRLYYVCNNSEFKKVSVSLGKLKQLS